MMSTAKLQSLPVPVSSMRFIVTVFVVATLAFVAIYFVDFDTTPANVITHAHAPVEERVVPGPYYTRAERPFADCAKSAEPAKSFLMVFMSRSGSTAISQTLSIHSAIENKFEFLQPLIGPDYSSDEALNKTRHFFRDAIARGKIPGFKIRSVHVASNPAAWAALVQEFDTRIIWQYRKNLFKTALGVYARAVLNDSTATGGIKLADYQAVKDRCDMGVGCSFRIDHFDKFHGILTNRISQDIKIMEAVKTLDGDRNCMFELPYEDYLYHKEDTINDLFGFLGLKAESMDTFKVKATADSLCSVVENFDELCTKFYGCPIWQPYLDDFQNNCQCVNFTHGSTEFCSMYSQAELDMMVNGADS